METKRKGSDRNAWVRQEDRRPRTARNWKLGVTVAIAVLLAIGVFAAMSTRDRSEEKRAEHAAANVPSITLPKGTQDGAIIALDGTPQAGISGLPADAAELDLSPDGRTIAFITADGGHGPRIATMRVDGTQLHVLTKGSATAEDPTWSPDGSRIAYSWGPGGGPSGIYVMDADGGNVMLVASDRYRDFKPRWSPDGKTIVYVSLGTTADDDPQFTPKPDIWAVSVDGGAPVQLTTERGPDLYPDFSPDGSQIVYRHDQELRVMNSDGSDPRVLLSGRGFFTPRWSPDGTRIAYGIYANAHVQVQFPGFKTDAPLLALRVLDLVTGKTAPVGDTGFMYDANAPSWWSNDAILIHRVGH